jgi:hypothetical protein
MIKKFNEFSVNEQIDISKFEDITSEINQLIKNTINNVGGDADTFIKSFVQNPEDVKIEGLINDSDIYEFYLKWRNDIDEILNNINFFDNKPTEINVFGLYEYIIKGTEYAVKEIVSSIK